MRAILRICQREWEWILLEKKYIILVVVAPILFMFLIGIIYSHRKITGIPIVIVDQDHTSLSRELERAILSNESFSLAGYIDSSAEFVDLAARDRARLCFIFRRGLEDDLKSRKRARIEVLVDNSNYLVGSVAISNFTAVLGAYSIGTNVRMLEAMHGIPKSSAVPHAMPLDVSQRMWFNPAFNSNYLNFMVPVFAYIPLQLSTLLVSVRAGASEYGERRFQAALRKGNSGIVILGKVLSYLVTILPSLVAVLMLPHWLLGVPFVATRFSFWLVLFWFAATMVTLGYGLSGMTKDALMTTEICAILTLPNFLLSGVTWPVFAMPKIMWPLAYGFPMNSVAFMVKKITVMGGSLADCGSQIFVLIGWSIVAIACAWFGTRRILKSASEGTASNV